MLYPLSYGRSAATGIPVRNVAKDYRLTLLRRKSPCATSRKTCRLTLPRAISRARQDNRLHRGTLSTQVLNLGHGLAEPAEPFVGVLPNQPHAPCECLGT
jgi:hypothetical protein